MMANCKCTREKRCAKHAHPDECGCPSCVTPRPVEPIEDETEGWGILTPVPVVELPDLVAPHVPLLVHEIRGIAFALPPISAFRSRRYEGFRDDIAQIPKSRRKAWHRDHDNTGTGGRHPDDPQDPSRAR